MLEIVKAFMWEWRFVIVAVIFMILFAWAWFKGKAYAIMLQAKSLAKDAVLRSGAEQEEWVIKALYKFLPGAITIWIPRPVMQTVVHHLYIKAKDYLDNGVLDNSIK